MRSLILISILFAPHLFAQGGQGVAESIRTDRQPLPPDTPDGLRAIPPYPLPIIAAGELQALLRATHVRADSAEFVIPGGEAASPPKLGRPKRADVKVRPYSHAGKLFFQIDGVENSCTAAFTGNGTVLLTAAHCVRNGRTGAWHSAFRFYRAYADGGGQLVTTRCVATLSTWPNPSGPNRAVDYAFIKTNETTATGWLGLRTGVPYVTWTAVGYPINYQKAKYEYEVIGVKGLMQDNIVQMKQNPMANGSSGGAWIGDLTTSTAAGNYAISVNSFRGLNPDFMYGPLFDAATVRLFEYVDNDCADPLN